MRYEPESSSMHVLLQGGSTLFTQRATGPVSFHSLVSTTISNRETIANLLYIVSSIPRPVQKYKPEIPSEPPTRPKFDLPLPQGIDHEVPRWSAVYSMFSEALRLLPQEGLHMNDRRRRDSVEREQGPDRNTSCSPSNYLSDPDTRNGDVQLNSHEPEITTQETDESVPSPDALSSMKATTTPWEEPISIHPRHAGAGMFFGELDALLRF